LNWNHRIFLGFGINKANGLCCYKETSCDKYLFFNTPNITRTSSFTYNKKGLLSSETIAPYTNKSLTTTYEYDRFGNKTKSTTTGTKL
jgi:hypothetical protein